MPITPAAALRQLHHGNQYDARGRGSQHRDRRGAPIVETGHQRHEEADGEQRIEDGERVDDALRHDGQGGPGYAARERCIARDTQHLRVVGGRVHETQVQILRE